jgi:TolB protein
MLHSLTVGAAEAAKLFLRSGQMHRKGFAASAAPTVAFVLLALAGHAHAASREPVLKQVDLPHSYYWRELYLPQLTTGPSSADFMPDSETLVYSMAGSLWRQKIGEDVATELTHAKGAYDYQPDVAPDGRTVVFTRYDGNAIELWRLDLESAQESRLTGDGAVNVEPRISPDGKRLAWVSTQGTGHFNLFVADLDAGGLRNANMLLGERESRIDRYYYSKFDHAINPSWSPDGKSIVYVGNPEVAWGSGDIMLVDVADPAKRRKVHSEETSWSARPDVAPDGKRILFSSYHGRQTHQLWLTTIDGAPPLPLTFGDDEKRNARWSPDGGRIVTMGSTYNTVLRVLDLPGGKETNVAARTRRTLAPTATVILSIFDGSGRPSQARVAVRGVDARAHGPGEALMHADDAFDRARQPMEAHYFHCNVTCTLQVPAGGTQVAAQQGFAHKLWQRKLELRAGSDVPVRIELEANGLPPEFGEFTSADLHVHMNYGGHYRMASRNLPLVAEDLDFVENLIVNKEERIPDIAEYGTRFAHGGFGGRSQEYHTSFWGHLGLPGLKDHLLLPDFSAYRHTALDSPYPHNGVVADLAHAQGALVGYVHPFDTVPDPEKESISNALPADVAHGKVDYLEVVGFSDHKSTAQVWYRLLNLGFRLPAGAGTDAMANYASLRGPIGMNRVFLDTAKQKRGDGMHAAIKAGRGFVSNGPLLGLLIDGKKPGESTHAASSTNKFKVAMRSIVPVDHLELVVTGEVVHELELGADRTTFDGEGTITLPPGGWVLLRAWNDGAHPDILDIYPYATTNPVWIEGEVVPDARDADYFVAWLDRTIAAADARTDWNNADEERETLDYLRAARAIYAAKGTK